MENIIYYNPFEISFASIDSLNINSECGTLSLDSNIWIDSNYFYRPNMNECWIYTDGPDVGGACGHNLPTTPKYYPLRQYINNDTLYGWIRIESHPAYMIIYDAAINSVPNEGLYSGQTTIGISELYERTSVEIGPSPVTNELHVKVNNQSLSEILLYETTGRKLSQIEFTGSVNVNTSQLANGIYIYRIRNKGGIIKNGRIIKN